MTLKIQIIGDGNAAKHHKAALQQLPELYEIINRGKPDVVAYCIPPSAKLITPVSKHRVIEKPFASSLFEMDGAKNVPFRLSEFVKFHPVLQYEWANAFKTGWHEATNIQWKRDKKYYEGWRGKYDTAVGGVLASHSIHYLDLIDQKVAPIRAIDCEIAYNKKGVEVETAADIMLSFDYLEPMVLVHSIGNANSGQYIKASDGYKGWYTQLAVDIKHGVDQWDRARRAMELLTACYWSAHSGKTAYFPIEDNHPMYKGWADLIKERK